jgi:hypothetical protein
VSSETIALMSRPEPMPVDVISALLAAVAAELVVEETAELMMESVPCWLALMSACPLQT